MSGVLCAAAAATASAEPASRITMNEVEMPENCISVSHMYNYTFTRLP